jgi:hypothetical protein
MPRGIPASGVRKQRTSRKTSTGGREAAGSSPRRSGTASRSSTRRCSSCIKATVGNKRAARAVVDEAGTGQKRATGTRQRRAAAA